MSHKKFDEPTANLIREKYEGGASLRMLAAEYQTNTITIKNTVIRRGGVMRAAVRPPRPRKERSRKGYATGANHHNWKGGRVVLNGYYFIVVPNGDLAEPMRHKSSFYCAEHRYVMAHALRRPLEQHETVHHINGDRLDNRLENLQLRQGKHGTGVVHVCADCGSRNVIAKAI